MGRLAQTLDPRGTKLPTQQFSMQNPKTLLLEGALYDRFEFEGQDNWKVIDFLFLHGTYDNFCTDCQRDSTFEIMTPVRPGELKRNVQGERFIQKQGVNVETTFAPPGIQKISGRCARTKSHLQDFLFIIHQHHEFDGEKLKRSYSTIQKIGQYPSYADVHIASVKKYSSVLSKDRRSELVRALGLASHDVGIGAYVYLRRIFEFLVEDAHQLARADASWDDDAYARSRMSEKIAQLKGHLPTFLVEHPQIYSLLSKGIHELTEQECLQHFGTLRVGIELILDETLSRKHQEQKISEAKAALAKALGSAGV